MPLATGAGRDIYYVAESSFAQTPATPVFSHMRTTGGALNLRKNNRTSNEVRSDRQIGNLIYGAERVEGELAFEYSYGTFDDLLSMALMNDWSTDVLKAGTLLKTATFEEYHADINQYIRSRGCSMNTFSMSMTTDEVTGSFGVLGKAQSTAQTEISGASYGNPTTSEVVNGFTGAFEIDGAGSSIITQVDFSLENGQEVRNALGGATIEHKYGRSNLTGTMSMYFEDLALYTKFVNGQTFSLQCALTDGTDTTTILLPRLYITEPDRPVEGESDIIVSIPFQAVYDTVEESNIVISR